MWQKLLEPDNLKILVPVCIGLLAACVAFISAVTVAIATHFLTKRAEGHKIRVSKGYELAEKIAKELERTENGYRYFEEFWRLNYGHLNDFNKAIQNFDSKQSLFQPQYDSIRKHAEQRHKLGSLLLGAWLYLPDKAVGAVQDYLTIGQFSFHDDAFGMINEYHEKFFQNLLDLQNKKKRDKAYQTAAKRLKKLKL